MKRETVYRWLVLFLIAFIVGAFAIVAYSPLEPLDTERERLLLP